jgi:hypothetical protein
MKLRHLEDWPTVELSSGAICAQLILFKEFINILETIFFFASKVVILEFSTYLLL